MFLVTKRFLRLVKVNMRVKLLLFFCRKKSLDMASQTIKDKISQPLITKAKTSDI